MMNDGELLCRYAVDGAEGAFEELVRRHTPLVHSSALRRVGTGSADDVTQAVFIVLSRKAKQLCRQKLPSLAGWLYKATRLAALEVIREKARRERREEFAAKEQIPMTTTTDDSAAWEQVKPLLDAALDSLGNMDREAVLLRYVEGSSFADVGRTLNVSENTATQRVHRAVKRLHKFLTGRGGDVSLTVLPGILTAHAATPATLELTASCMNAVAAAIQGTPTGASLLAAKTLKTMLIGQVKVAAATGLAGLALCVAAIGALNGITKPGGIPVRLESIEQMPFTYMGRSVLPDDTVSFQLNSVMDSKTRFTRLGQEVEGFKVLRHDEKYEDKFIVGIPKPQRIDISELVLMREGREYTLVFNSDPSARTYVASLAMPDGKPGVFVRAGDTFDAGGERYQVMAIEFEQNAVRVKRMSDGRGDMIRRRK